jgi:Fe-S-cluster-containing dehydrogenase component/DMSO reductase anchor subunit
MTRGEQNERDRPSGAPSPSGLAIVPAEQEWSLIDWYQRQPSDVSAVDEFSRVHEQLKTPVYRALMPATAPRPGEQYAFEVDLDRCSGCKACVTACHSLNGLDDEETWRDVGLLTGGSEQQPFMQHVTTACHHCLEPACMDVCPTLAYEKDPITGIVKHLDDQCFGCQYCILACPYNVPKYNPRLGIVRKCDLCSQRLAVGEAPACVQACPHEAIQIQIVNVEQVHADCQTGQFLPGTPDPQYTLPTTNYKTRRPQPRNLIPADYFRIQTEHAHRPLVTMLVLTQLSVGAFCCGALLDEFFGSRISTAYRAVQFSVSMAFCYVALTASLVHLGRPWLAYRAMLGLRRSWLSREILTFGIFAATATWLTGSVVFSSLAPNWEKGATPLEFSVVGSGLAGVFCSAMIYHRTKRPFWNIYQTGARFGLTTLLLGLSTTWLSFSGAAQFSATLNVANAPPLDFICLVVKRAIIAVAILKGLFELCALLPLADHRRTSLKQSALLLVGPLRRSLVLRFVLLANAGIFFTVVSLLLATESVWSRQDFVLALLSVCGLTWGEFLERSLFFKASVAFRMPGGPSA